MSGLPHSMTWESAGASSRPAAPSRRAAPDRAGKPPRRPSGSVFAAHDGDIPEARAVPLPSSLDIVAIDELLRVPNRMDQDDVLEPLPGGAGAQHGDERRDPGTGSHEPERPGVGKLGEHEKA